MKVSINLWLILIALSTFASGVPVRKQSEKSRAVKVVKDFYQLHFGRDNDVSEKHLAKMRKYLAPELYESFRVKLIERNEFVKKSPNMKTHFERFGFELAPEACRYAYKIGQGTVNGDAATVEVNLYNSKKCRYDGGALVTIFRIELVKINDQWLIGAVSF